MHAQPDMEMTSIEAQPQSLRGVNPPDSRSPVRVTAPTDTYTLDSYTGKQTATLLAFKSQPTYTTRLLLEARLL